MEVQRGMFFFLYWSWAFWTHVLKHDYLPKFSLFWQTLCFELPHIFIYKFRPSNFFDLLDRGWMHFLCQFLQTSSIWMIRTSESLFPWSIPVIFETRYSLNTLSFYAFHLLLYHSFLWHQIQIFLTFHRNPKGFLILVFQISSNFIINFLLNWIPFYTLPLISFQSFLRSNSNDMHRMWPLILNTWHFGLII